MTAPGAEAPLRLFLACDLPPDVLTVVEGWQQRVLKPVRELRVVASLHLTLVFLGGVPRAAVEGIVNALRPVTFTPIASGLEGLVFLPERGAKRVLALRVADPSGELATLQSQASAVLCDAGVCRPSRRSWLPHVTVARYRRPGQPFSLQNVTIPEFGVDRMVLYSSVLERAGAVHTPLAEFPAS